MSERLSYKTAMPAGVVLIVLAVQFASCTKSSPPAATRSSIAASPTPAIIRTSSDVVKVNSTSTAIPAGSSGYATVSVSISSGYHVNANPATFPYLIPTELKADKIEGITANKPSYPPALTRKFQFADQPLSVYEGEAPIKLPLRATGNAAKGIRPLPITVRVQACDNEKCFPPATLNSYVSVEVK